MSEVWPWKHNVSFIWKIHLKTLLTHEADFNELFPQFTNELDLYFSLFISSLMFFFTSSLSVHLKLVLLRLLYFNLNVSTFIIFSVSSAGTRRTPPLVCVGLVNKVLVIHSVLNRPSEIRRLIGAFRSQLTAQGGSLFRFLWADWGRGNSPWWSVNSSWGTWSIFSLGWYLMMLAVYLCQNTELFLVVLNSVWAGWTGSFHTIPQCHDEPGEPRRWCSEILTAEHSHYTLSVQNRPLTESRVWARLRMDPTDAKTEKMWRMRSAEGPTWRSNRQTEDLLLCSV